MGFRNIHTKLTRTFLVARLWSARLNQAQIFVVRKLAMWCVVITFIATFVGMWLDESTSFLDNPISYGTTFQVTFYREFSGALVMVLICGAIFYGMKTLVDLTAMAPILCSDEALERYAEAGNGAAAGELAERLSADPVQRNFWQKKALKLGYNPR